MYDRMVQKAPLSEIRVLFETINPIPNSPSNFNAAPTQVLPVVRLGAKRHSAEGKLDPDGRRSLDLLLRD